MTASVGTASGSAELVVDQQVAEIRLSPDSARLTALQDTQDFEADVTDANGSPVAGASVRWVSSDTSVAAVDSTGRAVSRANGTTSIRATADNGAADSVRLTVEQQADRVVVSPGSASFDVIGEVELFRAEVTDSNGQTVADADPVWSSSDPSVATVDSTGEARARGAGRAKIRAKADGASDAAEVTFRASSVDVDPASETVEVGGTTTFDATARDADGQQLPGADISWRSLATAVATVDSTGRATGESSGEAEIVATARGGAADTARLTVEEAEEEEEEADADLEAVRLDFRPTGLLTGETTTADLIVRNDGGAVESYDWRVTEGGSELASGTVSNAPTVDTIAVSGLGSFSQGVHELAFEVDPDDAIQETDEGNNRAEAPLDSRASGFRIETQLVGDVSARVQQEVPDAAGRWESVITGDLRDFDPDVLANDSLDLETCYDDEEDIDDRTETIDDLLMLVREDSIDGPGGTVAQAGPCWVRSSADPGGELARMPIVSRVTMDSADVDNSDDVVEVVLAHEFGHGLGLVFGPDVGSSYTGAEGVARYHAIGGSEATPPMGRGAHWEEDAFDDELMTPFIDVPSPLSVVSVGALADRSYAVSFFGADSFSLSVVAAFPPEEAMEVGEDVLLERIFEVNPATGEIRLLEANGPGGGIP